MSHKKGFYEKYIKRPLDFVFASAALVGLSPVIGATALLVRIKLGSPVLFKQNRPGKDEKEFYIHMCIKNNYSARELIRQIPSGYYQRYMLSNGSALESVEKTINEDDIPAIRILDRYSLEFLDLPNNYLEKDLRKAIVRNLKDFILEIGKETHARWNALIRFRAFLIDKEALCQKIRG